MRIQGKSNTIFRAIPVNNLTFRVPGKMGATIVGNLTETGVKKNLTNIGYRIIKNGKIIEEHSYENKYGFNSRRLEELSQNVERKVKDGYSFLKEMVATRNRGESLMLDQHIHGAFGVDFNKAEAEEISDVANKLYERGIGAIFPTLVTDSVENIKRQVERIKEAAKYNSRILGIHLEGIFINEKKKGIHNSQHFLKLTPENYQFIEDDFIKIVTLAPELDEGLIDYLHSRGIKVQAGHCTGWGNVDGVTHTFNAMSEITHRKSSSSLSALTNDSVYAEIIADGVHVSDEALKLFFKSKPLDKSILISDALPITDSDLKEALFADSVIRYDGKMATSSVGTLAGSTMLLDKIINRLKDIGLFKREYIDNPWKYHGM
ncbi:hypothetical protein IKB17_03905 [bacterium]|nr:hypothetical protein [bacterium]